VALGNIDNSILGWPNGSFNPGVNVSCPSDTDCTVRIKGGGAFLKQGDDYLNGKELEFETPVPAGDYSIELRPGIANPIGHLKFEWRYWSKVRLSIQGPDGREIATSSNFSRDSEQTLPVGGLLDETIAELRMRSWHDNRPDRALAQLAGKLEQWSSSVLLRSGHGRCQILRDGEESQKSIPIGSTLDIYWPGKSHLRFTVDRKDTDGVIINFSPLWQRWSVIPEPDAKGSTVIPLTIDGQPRPSDYMFLLPLSEPLPAPQRLSMRAGLFADGTSHGFKDATSSARVPIGENQVVLNTVRSTPRYGWIVFGVFLAWAVYSFSLTQTLRDPVKDGERILSGLPQAEQLHICGITFVVWLFLLLRLGLALRYAQDPAYLDEHALTGVVWALAGLALVPTLLLKTVASWMLKLERPLRLMPGMAVAQQIRKSTKRIQLMTYISSAAVVLEILLAQTAVFPILPASAMPIQGVWKWTLLLLFLAGMILWTTIRSRSAYPGPGVDSLHSPAAPRYLKPFYRIPEAVESFSTLLKTRAYNDKSLWQLVLSSTNKSKMVAGIFIVTGAGLSGLFILSWFVSHLGWRGSEPIKEIVAPTVLCLGSLCILFNIRFRFSPGTKVAGFSWVWLGLTLTALLLALSLVVGYPLVTGDAGAEIVALSIYIPITILLLVGWKPLQLGVINLAVVLLCGVFAVTTVLHAPEVSGVLHSVGAKLPGQVEVRVLVSDGQNIMQQMPKFSGVKPQDDVSDQGVSALRVRQAFEHGWETRAIARLGDYPGLGFGHAPTRQSQVPQAVLQFDSTFSFFILSEHGLIGGVALLLLYAVPMMIFLRSARDRMSVGQAMAIAIACSFFLEAATHALMNVGAVPMTGRSMPFLSVRSLSDLVRWTIFFRVAVQASLWRLAADGTKQIPDKSILAPPQKPFQKTPREPFARWAITVGIFGLLVTGLIGWVVVQDRKLVEDKTSTYDEFTWSEYLKQVNEYVRNNQIRLEDGQIGLDPELIEHGTSVIAQEAARFNGLPEEEQVRGITLPAARDYHQQAAHVRSLADYDAMMAGLREKDRSEAPAGRPAVFQLIEKEDHQNRGQCPVNPMNYQIAINQDFNSVLTFKRSQSHDDVPTISLAENPKLLLAGPAWVNGSWREASSDQQLLPSLNGFLPGLEVNQGKLLGKNLYLTLNEKLQKALQEFLAVQGRDRHKQLLERAGRCPADIEPPRVAITVLDLKTGEVLGMGGWPNANPGNTWSSEHFGGRLDLGEHLLPSTAWLQSGAPASLRTRYGGERNFQPQLMGSSTKPLWAAAVLAVHPSLDRMLGVTGPGGPEHEIFGIPLQGTPWGVEDSSGPDRPTWCDFSCFLTRSDNRYQVRLGFLGLAEDDGRGGVLSVGHREPGLETMNMSRPWTRYPMFPQSLGFGDSAPNRTLHNLESSPLAGKLFDLYGVSTKEGEDTVEVSVWTGNEANNKTYSPDLRGLRWMSPRATNFQFKKKNPENKALRSKEYTPREYITLLLGGGANEWPNIDFAGAFGSTVVGTPIVPHLLQKAQVNSIRVPVGTEIAKKLRPGLQGVVTAPKGTAYGPLYKGQSRRFTGHFAGYTQAFSNLEVYAKTGTLRPSATDDGLDTSRIALVAVRWKPGESEVKSGIVFSVLVERGQQGMASDWLGRFLDKNGALVNQLAERHSKE